MDSTLCHDTRNAGLPLQLSHQYSSGKRYFRRTMSPRGSLRGRPDVTWHVDRRTATRSKCTGLGALTQLGHPTCGNGHPFPSKGPFDGTVRVWVVSLVSSRQTNLSPRQSSSSRLSKLVLIHSRQARCLPYCVRSDGTDGDFSKSRNRTRILLRVGPRRGVPGPSIAHFNHSQWPRLRRSGLVPRG